MKKLIFAASAVLAITLSTSTANAQIFQFRFPCLFPRLAYRTCSPCSQGYSCSPCSQVANVEYAPRPCSPCSTCSQAPTACAPCSCDPCAGGSCKIEEAETEQLPAAPESAPSPCDPCEPCGSCGYSTECSDGACTLTDPVENCTTSPCSGGTCSQGSCSLGSCANALVERLNATRARLGYSRFEFDATLERGASYQASVCRSYGRLIHAGGVAEILAQSSSLDGAIQQWLASPPHRALLLSGYRRAGVGVVRDAYGRSWYAVQFR